ncbi:MAG: hypothetical protein BroJett040_04750 [Oligoflexia bacterium]|nr:MAG: hypothetical protein BroJett040_04750 [Oligoflexia bacterium]
MILTNFALILLLLIVLVTFTQRMMSKIRKNFDLLPSSDFFKNISRIFLDAFFGLTFDGHIRILGQRYILQKWNLRSFHLGLALGNISVFLGELVCLGAVYHLSRENVFLKLTQSLELHYSQFLLSVASSNFLVLAFWLFIGFFFGLVFKSRFVALVLGLILVFPFYISIPAFIVLVLGERLGVLIRNLVVWSNEEVRQSLLVLTGCLGLTLLVFLTFGGFLRSLVEMVALEGNRPGYRFLQAFLLLKLVQFIDTVITLTVFHFYSQSKRT